jgi:hypothetical protein
MRRRNLGLAAAGLLGFANCVATGLSNRDLQEYSAGHVGCQPEEIAISDYLQRHIGRTWYATCEGKRFLCSQAGADIACSPK